jgi:CRP-like cAMP-binding protein
MISNHTFNVIGTPDFRSLRVGRASLFAADAESRSPAQPREGNLQSIGGAVDAQTRAAMGPTGNRLWGCLPSAERERLLARSELVHLKAGAALIRTDEPCTHVHFLTGATVSLLLRAATGHCCQIGMIANEGMVGVHSLLSGKSAFYEAVVRRAGMARRVALSAVVAECGASSETMHLFLRYSQALTQEIAHAALCCQHHNVEQRTCRFLLQAFDTDGPELELTQELMAELLGVRRESVTAIARRLNDHGAIRYSRGRIAICNRAELEARCCECYPAVKRRFDAVFTDVPNRAGGMNLPNMTLAPAG